MRTNTQHVEADRADRRQESRVRALARRQGLAVVKSRSRNPQAVGYGTYMLINPYNSNAIVAYGLSSGYGLTLDEIEEQLLGDRLGLLAGGCCPLMQSGTSS